ncbi:hypothetical protein NCR96_00955 [Helicobacter sp. 14348-15]|nr:hypothetical protein [Helicobacter colisuis]MCL9820314.1 hypothetical protein [Helicobacter colisuis]
MQGISYMIDSTNKATDTKELESKIDSLVYKLYHLTNDEIKIIKGK